MSKEVSVKISDRLYIKHALMFVFSDVFVNYVREFESEVNASGFKFKHDVKYHFNSFLKFLAQSKKCLCSWRVCFLNHRTLWWIMCLKTLTRSMICLS